MSYSLRTIHRSGEVTLAGPIRGHLAARRYAAAASAPAHIDRVVVLAPDRDITDIYRASRRIGPTTRALAPDGALVA